MKQERLIMDNLPELRDIHVPDGVSAFPPAYGWWVVVALFLLAELFLLLRRASKKLYARRLLQNITSSSPVNAAVQMSEILRRICVYKYPEAAALSGRAWLDFLNAHAGTALSGQAAELLINAPYVPADTESYRSADLEALRRFCYAWIGENL